jgi:hypothetical protein
MVTYKTLLPKGTSGNKKNKNKKGNSTEHIFDPRSNQPKRWKNWHEQITPYTNISALLLVLVNVLPCICQNYYKRCIGID